MYLTLTAAQESEAVKNNDCCLVYDRNILGVIVGRTKTSLQKEISLMKKTSKYKASLLRSSKRS